MRMATTERLVHSERRLARRDWPHLEPLRPPEATEKSRGSGATLLSVQAVQTFQPFDEDQRVILHDISWPAFEAMLALRGDASGVRMYYLDGELELLSPTKIHEGRKKTLARLLEF